VLALHFSMIC